jgi:hypothetical protein
VLVLCSSPPSDGETALKLGVLEFVDGGTVQRLVQNDLLSLPTQNDGQVESDPPLLPSIQTGCQRTRSTHLALWESFGPDEAVCWLSTLSLGGEQTPQTP